MSDPFTEDIDDVFARALELRSGDGIEIKVKREWVSGVYPAPAPLHDFLQPSSDAPIDNRKIV